VGSVEREKLDNGFEKLLLWKMKTQSTGISLILISSHPQHQRLGELEQEAGRRQRQWVKERGN